MARKKSGPLINLRKDLEDIMTQVSSLGNEALNEASDLVKERLIQNTPENTGRTKSEWRNVNEYDLVKYIFNESLSVSRIPIVNLLEFGSKGKPFAIRTFRDCFDEIESKLVNKLNQVKIN